MYKRRAFELFPKRRSGDHRNPFSMGYLTIFTDLMALLLTFFILMYAARKPVEPTLIVIDPPAIAAPVKPSPSQVGEKPSLNNKSRDALELNYIAGLLYQLSNRDENITTLNITNFDHALYVQVNDSVDAQRAVITRALDSQRHVIVRGPDALLGDLWGISNGRSGNIVLIPSDQSSDIEILIH